MSVSLNACFGGWPNARFQITEIAGQSSSRVVEPFIVAIFDSANYAVLYPDCEIMLGDINASGEVNSWDIEPFLELLFR